MADNTDISQFIPETAASSGDAQISQAISEIAADSSSAQISQLQAEIGANASSAQISQLQVEIGPSASAAIISQLTIELGRGPVSTVVPSDTFVFGIGALRVNWWIIPQLSDSGDELRDKVVKPFWVTGRVHNGKGKFYRYGATDPIDMDDLEEGIGNVTTTILADQDEVTRSKLYPVNIPRALLHTLRLEGSWDGTGEPDRIDEFGYQVARSGIRR